MFFFFFLDIILFFCGIGSPNERIPLLFIDVNTGSNLERITIYENDTSESLAEAFCEKHSIIFLFFIFYFCFVRF